jgi:membrane protease YdiL (CAAX protease family)
MPSPDEKRARRRLRNIVALLLAVALVALAAVLARSLSPGPAVMEQRAAERAAWEKNQTAEQRANAAAWDETVREMRREQGLMALVFLLGNVIIAATFIRSTRATARDVGARRLRLGGACVRVLGRGTLALGAACAVMIAVPLAESIIAGGHGMYAGEQMLAAVYTLISFLLVWFVSLGLACAVLWRRSRADA